jgi:glutaminyl-tRNA synthetase
MSDGPTLRIANTGDQLAAHLAATGGGVVTRFPPEPNGYLHLGHAKACHIDFGLAAARGGRCYLRFDDTNPTAERVEFIDHIREIVGWLGWEPAAVTYSSDYFDRLHAVAVDLIRNGHAYVCHQTAAEIKASREARVGSPWRDRPAAESLRLFDDMRRGAVAEGAATLRLRMDPGNANFNMFDLVAYRVKFAPHPHAGDRWCIYPSYDFTHCLVDSFENVTHSLCTLEFEPRRASYYWLLHVARAYKPVVWEYSRLSVTHNVLSKRKLAALVRTGAVRGWDDPRLLTLAGLRRRGVPAAAINAFCREVGITRAGDGEVSHLALDAATRAAVDGESPRALAVLRPLRVTLTNVGEGETIACEGRVWPNKPDDATTYPLHVTRTVYIDEADFRPVDAKNYFGLAPGKAAMLRYAGVVTVTGWDADPATGAPAALTATFERLAPGARPPKGVLAWVGEEAAPGAPSPRFEARLYGPLFKSQSPGALGDGWEADVDPASEQIVRGALGGPPLAAAKPGDRFQLERLGFFVVDTDTGPDGEIVLNRTVTLRETQATKGVKG